jgi:hypothetical protein
MEKMSIVGSGRSVTSQIVNALGESDSLYKYIRMNK